MLLSLLALVIAASTLCISYMLGDEITRLLIKLIGLFSLFLSLVYSPWLIKLLIVIAVIVTPNCAQQHYLRRTRCSTVCVTHPDCPCFSI
jgi:hypothetical protein